MILVHVQYSLLYLYHQTSTNMKSLAEIKNQATGEDYITIAESVGRSVELVRKIVAGKRTDTCNVRLAFNIHFKHKADLEEIATKKREQLKAELELYNQEQEA